MTAVVAEVGCERRVFQLGEVCVLRELGPSDSGVIQDEGRIGVEKVYKLVPKSSMNERW